MKKLFRKTTWMLIAFMSIMSSCDKQEPIEQSPQKPQDGDIAVGTEIIVDGENVTNTRAASEAGYTTGDGLYDSGDPVTVAAFANDGYELTAFYDKQYPDVNLGSSHTFPAKIPQTFKAEFARKFTISVSASPSDGGTVTGGGKYKNGTSCTLIATPKSGYTFDGWYEASSKLSSNSSYSFTVSSNRTMTAKFNVGIGNNIINAEVSYIGTSGMKVRVTSEYPITSPINIKYAARGEYWATIDYPDGSSRDELYEFDGLPANTTLAAGQSQWEISYIFGISASQIRLVNWYIDFTEFSDKSYNYKKGNTNGMEYN